MIIKTDWINGNFDVEDYNRIANNINENIKLSNKIYENMSSLAFITRQTTPLPDVFNRIETALQSLIDKLGLNELFEDTKKFNGNDVVWDADDINRIERTIDLLNRLLIGQQNGIQRLSFRLGGAKRL